MGNYFSCLVTRPGLQVVWSPYVTSHETLIKSSRLRREYNRGEVLKVELRPLGKGAQNALFTGSGAEEDWEYRVALGPGDTLPNWYYDSADVVEAVVRKHIPYALEPYRSTAYMYGYVLGYVEGLTLEEAMARDDLLSYAEVDRLVASGVLPQSHIPVWTSTRIRYSAGSLRATITDKGQTYRVQFPLARCWREIDEHGLPFGRWSDGSNTNARYLSRSPAKDYDGLLRCGGWGRGGRYEVYAEEYEPHVRYGALVRVKTR